MMPWVYDNPAGHCLVTSHWMFVPTISVGRLCKKSCVKSNLQHEVLDTEDLLKTLCFNSPLLSIDALEISVLDLGLISQTIEI